LVFSIEDFAKLYAEKLGVKGKVLQKTLWGDFYFHSKTKRVMKGAQEKAKKPLFVQFVLENLWEVYDTVVVRKVGKAVLLFKFKHVKFETEFCCRLLYSNVKSDYNFLQFKVNPLIYIIMRTDEIYNIMI
jgi:hypothetical protein